MRRATSLHDPANHSSALGNWVETLLEFVKWTQAQQPLEHALADLGRHFGAEAICIARRDRFKPGVRIFKTCDSVADLRKPRLDRSYAGLVLGTHLDNLKAGAAIFWTEASQDNADPEPELIQWTQRRGIAEILILCLESQNGVRDFIELHFSNSWHKNRQTEADTFAKALAEVYAGRRPGLIQQELLSGSRARRPEHATSETQQILAPGNPAGLTRSEWRLCFLVAKGLSRSGVAEEMRVTQNTMRTHLRAIYAKTGYETFHDLALRLVSSREQQALCDAMAGQAA